MESEMRKVCYRDLSTKKNRRKETGPIPVFDDDGIFSGCIGGFLTSTR